MFWLFLFPPLLVVAGILLQTGTQRAVWLATGLFFFQGIIGGGSGQYTLYLTAFILSLWTHGEIRQEWKAFPFKKELAVLFILHVAVAAMDPRGIHNPLEVCLRTFKYFIPRYAALFVGFAAFRRLGDWLGMVRPLSLMLAVVGLYGVATWVLQANPYDDALHMAFEGRKGIWADVESRGYRVFSTLTNPIVYGYVMCIAASLTYLWKRQMNTVLWTGLLALALFNVFLANSRTGVVAGLILVGVFLLSKYRLSYRMYCSIALCAVVLAVSYYCIPVVRHVTDSTVDIFTSGGVHTRGSTVELKFDQLAASLYLFYKHPFFGNGFNYFWEAIRMEHVAYRGNLAGLEGFGYKLLVEEGIFMIIAVAVLFFNLSRYFWTRRYSGDYAHAGMAWTLSFLAFMLFTGTHDGIFTIGMVFIGMLAKLIRRYEVLHMNAGLQRSPLCRTLPG